MFVYLASKKTIVIKTQWERQVLRFRNSAAASAYIHVLLSCGLVQVFTSGNAR